MEKMLRKNQVEKAITQAYKKSDIFSRDAAWFLVSLVPFLMMITVFVTMKWSWGLMDDFQTLEMPGGLVRRVVDAFHIYLNFGELKPIFALYMGVCYKIFAHHPLWFYIFKAVFTYAVLFGWGWQAYRLTQNRLSLFLVPVVTLSFHYFYDVFFFLSSHEIFGLFFTGLALHFFVNVVNRVENDQPIKFWLNWVGLFFCLLAAFGSKEPFVSCGIAIGLAYLVLAKKSSRQVLFWQGILIVIFTIGYALYLKLRIQSGHTQGYDITNFVRMRNSLIIWLKRDFINHVPWLAALAFVNFLESLSKRKRILNSSLSLSLGIVLGILFYAGYLLILLPWNTASYFASPFGLFFAFGLTIFLVEGLSRCLSKVYMGLILCALVLNIFVCQYTLTREAVYHYDTKNLMAWFHANADIFDQKKTKVYSNAMEPSMAIPGLMKRDWDSEINFFQYNTDPRVILGEAKSYYLFSPKWGSIDPALKNHYQVRFFSKNWILYTNRPKNESGL